MSAPLRLSPGSELPAWAEALDELVFGKAWGALEGHEYLLGLQPYAFARWGVIPAAQEAELLRLAVAPEARRQGLARTLLEASERFLAQEGITTLHLEVRVGNEPARALYEAMGWRPQHKRKAYYADGEDAMVYAKEL
ncbi:MAG TPA: GNAT family N-acetyltransferase [Holophaga sp.]|nr:GNAT family N-acetyltransferase [Holophaga sp.]